MNFPRPDRSNFSPNFRKSEDNGAIDIGWNEGFLSDGRPYRAEAWAEDQITSLTFFFSTNGLEGLSDVQLGRLLECEGLLCFRSDQRHVGARMLSDAAGNSMWSVNVVVGDETGTFVQDDVELKPYPRSS
jgi:hypothetical protein